MARNRAKFSDAHVFQLKPDEVDFLISQSMISTAGRGGSRTNPWVFSMKGVARLATILNSAQALRATDLIIDIFYEVWPQVANGSAEVTIANSGRLLPSTDQDSADLRKFRRNLFKALDGLLDTVVNSKTKATVRDEIDETTVNALDHLKERLKTRGLENDKLTAETLLILEQVRDLREKREAALKQTNAQTESIVLANLDKKIAIVQNLLKVADQLEPSAIVSLYREMTPANAPISERKALSDQRHPKKPVE